MFWPGYTPLLNMTVYTRKTQPARNYSAVASILETPTNNLGQPAQALAPPTIYIRAKDKKAKTKMKDTEACHQTFSITGDVNFVESKVSNMRLPVFTGALESLL